MAPFLFRRLGLPLLLAAMIAAVTVATFLPVGGHDFVLKDDGEYVFRNAHVSTGLSLENVTWALTAVQASNWHPLTWISHMLDVQLFGVDPGWLHRVNLAFHVLNALLLFGVLFAGTGAPWPSALTAALFALHPLHVESVAWISERKDVLSTLFLMLSLGAYLRYARKPSAGRFLPVAASMALGLLAKPMLVTLPLVLLLLDFWPLGRMRFDAAPGSPARQRAAWSLTTEKIPLFILAALSSLVTVFAQRRGGAMGSLEEFPLLLRVANALNSYVMYLVHTAFPRGLASFYPFPGAGIPAWRVLANVVALALVSALVLRSARRQPFLITGWLWYLATLLPVLGIIQVGGQAMADRYTYVPLTGIFLAAAWGAGVMARGGTARRAGLVIVSCSVLAVLAIASRRQVLVWSDNMTLLRHDVAVVANYFEGHVKLGSALYLAHDLAGAEANYRVAVGIRPGDAAVRNNLATVLFKQGRLEEALEHYRKVVEINPSYPLARKNLEIVERRVGATRPAKSVNLDRE